MVIDFSWSIDQWIAVIEQFFKIIKDFFAGIGINIFADAPAAEEETTEEASL